MLIADADHLDLVSGLDIEAAGFADLQAELVQDRRDAIA